MLRWGCKECNGPQLSTQAAQDLTDVNDKASCASKRNCDERGSEPHRQADVLGCAACVNHGVIVQAVPDALREIGGHKAGALRQYGGHKQGVTQHPLKVIVVCGLVPWEAEEEGPHDATPIGVRVKESSVHIGQHAKPPSVCLLCQDGHALPPVSGKVCLQPVQL